MIFSTVTFILYFLAPLLIIYYLVPKKAKNPVLFAASLLFCACAGLKFVLIPIASAAVNLFFGQLLGKHRTKPIYAALIAVNAVIPVIFRLLMTSNDIKWIAPAMILFCGTCMCGVRAMTYLTEVYKGTTAVQRDPVSFGLYMLFFPIFAIGPAVKYNDFRLQIEKRRLTGIKFLSGTGLFICGLLKKLIIADRLRNIWQAISGYDFTRLSLVNAWLGLIALVLYIYFMLASFWDMGVGMCRMFGFDVNRRIRPIEFAKKADKNAWLCLIPLGVSVICVLTAFSLKGMGQYIAALFRFGYIGWGEQDFMYRFTSNIGIILLALFVASGVVRFIIDALKPTKVKNSPAANALALVVMAALLAVSAIDLVSVAGTGMGDDGTGSVMDGTLIRQADSRITKGSFFRNRLFHFNADIGYILGQKGMNGVHYAKDSSLIERPLSYNEAAVDRFVEDVDYISEPERYNTYIAVIPPAFEHMKKELRPYTYDDRVVKVKDRVSALLSDSAIKHLDCSTQLFGSTSEDRMYSYNSTYLTADGEYAIYEMLGDMLGYEPYPMSGFDRQTIREKVRGGLWARAGYDLAPYDTYEELLYRNSTVTEGDGVLSEQGMYAFTYNSDARNGRALVIIGDGLLNNIPKLIAEHFDVVYIISIEYPDYTGNLLEPTAKTRSKEDIKQFMDENYITDVLVLCNTDTIVRDGQNSLAQ